MLLAVGQIIEVIPSVTSLLFAGAVLGLALYQYYEMNVKTMEYSFLEHLVND